MASARPRATARPACVTPDPTPRHRPSSVATRERQAWGPNGPGSSLPRPQERGHGASRRRIAARPARDRDRRGVLTSTAPAASVAPATAMPASAAPSNQSARGPTGSARHSRPTSTSLVRDTFFLVLDPQGTLKANPQNVTLGGLPDQAAVEAARRTARTCARRRSTVLPSAADPADRRLGGTDAGVPSVGARADPPAQPGGRPVATVLLVTDGCRLRCASP